MSQNIRVIKRDEVPVMHGDGSTNRAWKRAGFKSQLVMIRCHVDSTIGDDDRDHAEFMYAQLTEQCKKLSRKFGFRDIN